jgi:cytochrome P450
MTLADRPGIGDTGPALGDGAWGGEAMALHPATLEEIDYWDLDMFTNGDPHGAWKLQRETQPIWWHDRPGGEPYWSITRAEDGRAVFVDPHRFSSERHGITPRSTDALERDPLAGLGFHPMIHTDPPRHGPLRKLVSPRFTPRSISELEAQVRLIARACMDDAAEQRDVDFVTDVAHRTPAYITFALLDIPPEDWEHLAELEHRTVTSTDPEFAGGRDLRESTEEASAELRAYFAKMILGRVDNPGDDLLSVFLQGRIEGEKLPWMQVVAEAGLLLAGGLDTTRAAASAGAMLPLLSHGDQFRALAEDPSLLPVAIEEFLRWGSPVIAEARTVTEDLVFHGQAMHEGERVVVWGAACNRDPALFDAPETFDIGRQPNRHLSFAYGEHFCLGAHLARLVLRVEFEEFFARFSAVEQTGDAVRVRSNFLGGLKHLPVRLTPR